jgi:hypothetical protein
LDHAHQRLDGGVYSAWLRRCGFGCLCHGTSDAQFVKLLPSLR